MYDSLIIDLVHQQGIEVCENWAFPDFEIIVPYPLSLTYEIKDSGLTELIVLNTTQLIFGDELTRRAEPKRTEKKGWEANPANSPVEREVRQTK